MDYGDIVLCRGCRLAGPKAHMMLLHGVTKEMFLKCVLIEMKQHGEIQEYICVHCYRQTTAWASFRILVHSRNPDTCKTTDLSGLTKLKPCSLDERSVKRELVVDSGLDPDSFKLQLNQTFEHKCEVLQKAQKDEYSMDSSVIKDRDSPKGNVSSKYQAGALEKALEIKLEHLKSLIRSFSTEKMESLLNCSEKDFSSELMKRIDQNKSPTSTIAPIIPAEKNNETFQLGDNSLDNDYSAADNNSEDSDFPPLVLSQIDTENENDDPINRCSTPITGEIPPTIVITPLDPQPNQSSTIKICTHGINSYSHHSLAPMDFEESLISEENDWSCPICWEFYSDSEQLKAHLKDLHLSIEFPKCPLCDETFSRIPKALSHIILHHMQKMNTSLDNDSSTEPSNTPIREANTVEGSTRPRKRIRIEPRSIQGTCPICQEDSNHLRAHMQFKHYPDHMNNCCGFTFERFADAFRHYFLTHFLEYPCPDCKGGKMSRFMLRDHIKEYHADLVKVITCGVCNVHGMKGISNFLKHLQRHVEPNATDCPICSINCDNLYGVAAHMVREHNFPNPDLKEEFREVHEMTTTQFDIPAAIACHLCEGKLFTCLEDYTEHRNTEHLSVEESANEKEVRGRTEEMHEEDFQTDDRILQNETPNTSERSFWNRTMGLKICPICFKGTKNLFVHRLRRISCRFCGQKRCSKKAMARHINEAHRHRMKSRDSFKSSVLIKYSYK